MARMQTARTGCLPAFFGSAWHLATTLFATQHLFTGDRDKIMGRIYMARGIAGIIIVAGVTLRYHGIKAVGNQANQWVNVTERTVLVMALTLGVGLVLVLAWTKPAYWWSQIKQFRWPVLAISSFFAICYVFMLITWAVDPKRDFHQGSELATIAAALGYGVAVLWIFVFIPRAIYLLAGGFCRASDAHPFLGPLVSTFVVWYLALNSLVQGVNADGMPQKIALAVILGGPISVTMLSALEVFRLRHHQAWPFHEGPPTPAVTMQPSRATA